MYFLTIGFLFVSRGASIEELSLGSSKFDLRDDDSILLERPLSVDVVESQSLSQLYPPLTELDHFNDLDNPVIHYDDTKSVVVSSKQESVRNRQLISKRSKQKVKCSLRQLSNRNRYLLRNEFSRARKVSSLSFKDFVEKTGFTDSLRMARLWLRRHKDNEKRRIFGRLSHS